jgi:hypothetical protein
MKSAYGERRKKSVTRNESALLFCVRILSQIRNADEITRQVLKVLTAARKAGVQVFFSRHLSLPNELMGMFQFRIVMVWQRAESADQLAAQSNTSAQRGTVT